MRNRRNDNDGNSSGMLNLFLTLLILGGLGYLAYTHQEEIKSFDYSSINLESLKRLVGLAEPEATPAPKTVHHPAPSTETNTATATTESTNSTETQPVPVVGRPRPVLPAHDHWTWTTADGKTYQEVKVEKVEGDNVTIIHQEGGARLPISTLPDDVQKELNYYSSQL